MIQEEGIHEIENSSNPNEIKPKKIIKDTYRSNIEWLKAKNERIAQQQIIKLEEVLDKDCIFEPKINFKKSENFNFENFETR